MNLKLKKPIKKDDGKVYAYVTVEGAGTDCKNGSCS